MVDPREWAIAAAVYFALTGILAVFNAPIWAYAVTFWVFVAGIVLYQRQQRARDDFR